MKTTLEYLIDDINNAIDNNNMVGSIIYPDVNSGFNCTYTQTDIEAKKAEIERLQEEIDSYDDEYNSLADIVNKEDRKLNTPKSENEVKLNELQDKINTIRDNRDKIIAELKALEQSLPTQEVKAEQPTVSGKEVGSGGGDVESKAKEIVGESAFNKLKKEGYTVEKGKFDSDSYASFFGLHTGVQAAEFEKAGLRLVKPSEKIKVYRGKGKNVAEGENEGITWVAEDKKVAENYSGDGQVEEIEISKPKNPFRDFQH